jgi:hypothetical protein
MNQKYHMNLSKVYNKKEKLKNYTHFTGWLDKIVDNEFTCTLCISGLRFKSIKSLKINYDKF